MAPRRRRAANARRPHWYWAAEASQAGSMRSGRCGRSTCSGQPHVNQFDVYVGTSAGAFIAALCANGVTPEEMMRVVTHQGTRHSETSTWTICCAPTWAKWRARARCCRWGGEAGSPVGRPARAGIADGSFAGLAEGLPWASTRPRDREAICASARRPRAAPTTSASWSASCI